MQVSEWEFILWEPAWAGSTCFWGAAAPVYLAFADASPHSDPAQSAVWEVAEPVSVDL